MKSFLLLLLFIAPLGCFAAKVVFALPDTNNDPFWKIVLKGSQDAANALRVDLEVMSYSSIKTTDELNSIDIALSKPSDATIIVPYHQSNKIEQAIKKMSDADHFIQVINTGEKYIVQPNLKANYIGMNDYQAGLSLGKGLEKSNVKKVLFISHLLTDSNVVIARQAGIHAALPSSKIFALDVSNLSSIDAQKMILNKLGTTKDIDTIITLGPISFEYLSDALKLKSSKKIRYNIVSFDLSKLSADILRLGKVRFIIDQQPYLQGFYAVVNSGVFALNHLYPTSSIFTGPRLIYPSDIELIYNDIGITR
tara:strand:- start:1768 stop:2694 length:927 start_codon:yes stop_codon:yes gene_type:complete